MLVCIVTSQRTFLSAGSGSSQILSQRMLWAYEPECFTLLRNSNGTASLRTCHGTYLRAGDRGEVNQAQRLLEWEQWEVLGMSSGRSCLRSRHGRFLRPLPLLAGWAVDNLAAVADETCELEVYPVKAGTRAPCAYLCPVLGMLFVPAPPMITCAKALESNAEAHDSSAIDNSSNSEESREQGLQVSIAHGCDCDGSASSSMAPPLSEAPVIIEGYSRPRGTPTPHPQRLSSHYAV